MPNKLLLAAAERPAIRRFITEHTFTRAVANRFVAGDSLDDAIGVARDLAATGIGAILDLLGENVTSEEQADAAAAAYVRTLDAVQREDGKSHISVKLTQLGLDNGTDGTLERMEKICARAAEVGTVVAIDMESHEYTDQTIDVYDRLRGSYDNLVLCLQAYLKRTPSDVERLLPLRPWIRLCKGAYNEPDEIALSRSATNQAFKDLLVQLIGNSSYTAIATHDEELIRFSEGHARRVRIPKEQFEFQMLYGVRRQTQRDLVEAGYRVRVYIPFGDEWYPYLMRRLAERPANVRFFVEALLRG